MTISRNTGIMGWKYFLRIKNKLAHYFRNKKHPISDEKWDIQ